MSGPRELAATVREGLVYPWDHGQVKDEAHAALDALVEECEAQQRDSDTLLIQRDQCRDKVSDLEHEVDLLKGTVGNQHIALEEMRRERDHLLSAVGASMDDTKYLGALARAEAAERERNAAHEGQLEWRRQCEAAERERDELQGFRDEAERLRLEEHRKMFDACEAAEARARRYEEAIRLAIEDVLLMDSPEGDSPRNIAANLRAALAEERTDFEERVIAGKAREQRENPRGAPPTVLPDPDLEGDDPLGLDQADAEFRAGEARPAADVFRDLEGSDGT